MGLATALVASEALGEAPSDADADASTVEPSYGPPSPPPPEPLPVPSASVGATLAPGPSASVQAPSATVPTPPPSASAAPSSSAAAETVGEVRIRDAVVLTLRTGQGTKSAKARGEAASVALAQAVKAAKPEDVRVEQRADAAVIYAGTIPILQLGPQDARAAGDLTLADYAAAEAAKIREAIRGEQKRSAIAGTLFSISLVVLLGLVTLYLLRKIGELADKAKAFVDRHPDRIPALKIYAMEVVRPAAFRSGIQAGLGLVRLLLQVGLIYAFLLFTLSLFDSTRGYTEKLTGFVLSPLSALMTRIATSLSLMVVAAIVAVAVAVLVRFVGLFFASVARGETRVAWLPADLAHPTSILIRIAIVISTLVFGAPVVTGDPEGALVRTGTVAMAALGIAATPLLAATLVGVQMVYTRRLRRGEWAEIGDRVGRVRSLGLLEVRLDAADGSEVRIPYLWCLFRPTRLLGPAPRVAIELRTDASAAPNATSEALALAARSVGERGLVELLRVDAQGALYRISVVSEAPDVTTRLHAAVHEELGRAGIALGRGSGTGAA